MAAIEIDEATLTKGQARKLAALRKSIGDEITGPDPSSTGCRRSRQPQSLLWTRTHA